MKRGLVQLGLIIIVGLLALACSPAAKLVEPIAPEAASAPTGQMNGAAGAERSVANGDPSFAPSAPGSSGPAADQAVASQSLDRMIIRNASLNLTVKDVSAAMDQITELVERAGGYISSKRWTNSGENQTAALSLRIPNRDYENTMRELRQVGIKVNDETSSSQDVGEEYADLGAQLRNLEATEAQYLELLGRAQSIEDILKVQQRLNDVRGQIERIKGRMQFLERRTDFAQVNVTLVPEGVANAQQNGNQWEPLKVAQEAWEASLTILRQIATVAIAIVVFSWWLVPLAIIAYFIGNAIRHRRAAPPA